MTADEARYDRQNRMNPPLYPPGQDPTQNGLDSSMADIFSSSAQPVNTQGMGDIFSSTVGGTGGIGGLNTPYQDPNLMGASQNGILTPPQAQQAPKSQEDALFDAIGKIIKGIFVGGRDMFVDITTSMQGLTMCFWNKYFLRFGCTGLVVLIGGIILRLIGVKIGLGIAIGGVASAFFGIIGFGLSYDSAKKYTSMYAEENNNNAVQPVQTISQEPSPFNTSSTDFFADTQSSSEGWDSNWSSSSDSDGIYEEEDYVEEEEEDFDFDRVTQARGSDGMSAADSLNSLQEVPKGMYTRQYLYEAFSRVLPTMIPDFNREYDITEDDDEFYDWEQRLRDSAEVTGVKDENLPELLEVKKTMSTIQLTCTRPTGFKSDLVAKEIANLFAYKDGEFDAGVYAKCDNLGKNCIITVFTGKSAMVSLKDMMLDIEDYILNTKHYMPVIFGINQRGRVIYADMKKLESIIITGMPRSGKSWLVQAVLTQMCFFVSPKELHIYICDPKEGISDFKGFCLPHVKKFVSKDEKILETLRHIIKVEAPRRKKIIGDDSNVNIWDYKEKNPAVDLPIIYVVIDEVVTLAERMEKEVKQEFQGLLIELISQLPALGIRAFLIPHVIKNDIIAKTATDLVPCKISVGGDADHIEKATGSKPKDFPYKLSNPGDMAVRMPLVSPDTMFVHGPALTDSNVKNNAYFDYMRQVWSRLERDEVNNSVAALAEEDASQQELLEIAEDVDIFGDDEDLGFTQAQNDFIRGILG